MHANAYLEAEELPTSVAGLHTGLTNVDGDALSHGAVLENVLISNWKEKETTRYVSPFPTTPTGTHHRGGALWDLIPRTDFCLLVEQALQHKVRRTPVTGASRLVVGMDCDHCGVRIVCMWGAAFHSPSDDQGNKCRFNAHVHPRRPTRVSAIANARHASFPLVLVPRDG